MESGRYVVGPVPYRPKPDTPLEGVPPKPDTPRYEPGFRRITGWQFSATIEPPIVLPKSNSIGHNAASFKKRYRLAENMWATIQAQGREEDGKVRAKTALVTLDDFDVRPDDLEGLQDMVNNVALSAVVRFSKDTGARVGLVRIAKWGEVCKPDPSLAGAGRVRTSPTSEINQSGEYPSWESRRVLEAVAEYKLPDILLELDRSVRQYFEQNAKNVDMMTKALTTLIDMQNKQREQNEAILSTLNQLVNPPPRDTGKIGGYL